MPTAGATQLRRRGQMSAIIVNATITNTLPLQPPAFGFEGVFRYPLPPAKPLPGSHFQHTLRITGSVPKEYSDYHLRVDLMVRGALWRTHTHPLCTSMHESPELEIRECAKGSGAFEATVWTFVPSQRPTMAATAAALPADARAHARSSRGLLRQAGGASRLLHAAVATLERLNVCNLTRPLPDRLVGAACNASASSTSASKGGKRHGVSPDALMRAPAWKNAGKSDLYDVDWRAIGTMFVLASLTLPQPFTIVESGNFCGGTTGFLALLRRELCPKCPYYSLDPGGYRRKRHAKFTCHRASLEFAGLSDEVTFVDEPAPALGGLDLPVGFVYTDGGKVHFCNNPLHTYLDEKMMVGGLIGFDDTWVGWPGAPFAKEHIGQVGLVHELVQTGDWRALLLPPNPHRKKDPSTHGYQISTKVIAGFNGEATASGINGDLFPENVKQSLVVKSKSRFEQPGEREGEDAIRVALIERGGREVGSAWLPLPAV